MLKVVENKEAGNTERAGLDDIAREGARRMLQAALEAEVAEYIASNQTRDEQGRALVVRNGKGKARQVTTGTGTFEVQAPRVNDKRVNEDGQRQRFTSQLLPPYMRRSPKVAEVLPVLYLRGLSTGDFQEALGSLLGEEASGLSATNIARLTSSWQQEYDEFKRRDLSDRDYVYIWADGIHFNIRLEDERLCTLVMIGVRADGVKELLAIDDGYRESTESWAQLLRDLKQRGMQEPLVAVGDGALGFWGALRDVWSTTREQRCWCHKLGNVLNSLPKRLQGKAKDALHQAMYAETKEHAEEAFDRFVNDYEAKYPKATKCLNKDRESLLTFFDFPAEHWKHLRTTNIIESPFSTVRLRTRVTRGAGSRAKGLLMAFKLLDMAQGRWRKLNGSEKLPLVRGGVRFLDGIQLKKEQRNNGKMAA